MLPSAINSFELKTVGKLGRHTDSERCKCTLIFDHLWAAVPAFRDEGMGFFEGALNLKHKLY